jgi:opacity protein-like surface antigen
MLALLALSGEPALAVDAPSAELFGGYSYTKDGEQGLNGGEASLDLRLTRWISVEADASAHYGSALGTHTSRLFFMGGPRFAYRSRAFTIFTHYLAGGVRSRSGLTVVGVDIAETRTDFSLAFGGGVDVGISGGWAVRAQGDYALIRADGTTEKEPRFSAGLVYRFRSR